jgi:hypothetical protein
MRALSPLVAAFVASKLLRMLPSGPDIKSTRDIEAKTLKTSI